MKIKILKVDSPALQKGFRRGQVRHVIAVESEPVCNPRRGRLATVLGKNGVMEGFFPDQYRVKVKPRRGEFGAASGEICGIDLCTPEGYDKYCELVGIDLLEADDDDFSFVDPFTPGG